MYVYIFYVLESINNETNNKIDINKESGVTIPINYFQIII